MSSHLHHVCNFRQNSPQVHGGCGFIGNPDIYGLGVRLGIYSQWLSALLSNHLLSNSREDIHSAYFFFSLALGIATVVITVNRERSCVFFAEIFVLVSLVFGGYFSVHLFPITTLPQQRDWYSIPWRRGRLVILALVYGAMMLFNCWFWFAGRSTGFESTPCGSAIFLFAKFSGSNIKHGVRFYQGFSVAMAVYYPFGAFYLLQNDPGLLNGSNGTSTPSHSVKPIGGPGFRMICSIHFLIVSLICFVLAVLAIEMTLAWNCVSGVTSLNSGGQLIPLVIGVGGLAQVVWGIGWESVSISIFFEVYLIPMLLWEPHITTWLHNPSIR